MQPSTSFLSAPSRQQTCCSDTDTSCAACSSQPPMPFPVHANRYHSQCFDSLCHLPLTTHLHFVVIWFLMTSSSTYLVLGPGMHDLLSAHPAWLSVLRGKGFWWFTGEEPCVKHVILCRRRPSRMSCFNTRRLPGSQQRVQLSAYKCSCKTPPQRLLHLSRYSPQFHIKLCSLARTSVPLKAACVL